MPDDIAAKLTEAQKRVAAKRTQAQAARLHFTPYESLKSHYGEPRSREQLQRAVKAGDYPAPKQLSAARIGWVTAELDAHYDARPTVDWAPTSKGYAA